MDHNNGVLPPGLDLRFLPREIVDVVRAIADKHSIEWTKIFGRRRTKTIVIARQEAYSELYKLGKYSSTDLGKFFARHHATILHGIKNHRRKYETEA
jgi:chromosomal replication initiation ATPase DnaA